MSSAASQFSLFGRQPSGASPRRATTPATPSSSAVPMNIPQISPRQQNQESLARLGLTQSGRPTTTTNASSSAHSTPRMPPLFESGTPTKATMTAAGGTTAWRSNLLQLEVDLKELVAQGPLEPPSVPRIDKVLRYFDSLITDSQGALSEVLRLFRIEFCRAIFSGVPNVTGPEAQLTADSVHVPFFEKIDKMLRERNILQAELEAAESDHNVVDLRRQLNKLTALLPFYEQEIGRLTRECGRSEEEVVRLGKELEQTQRGHERIYSQMEDEARKLSNENRELQLQVFRLGKDNREQLNSQSMYQHFKMQKTERLHEMFSQGEEQAGLLLCVHQLEHGMNQLLCSFDSEFLQITPGEMASCRSKFTLRVAPILEEIHECEERCTELARMTREATDLLDGANAAAGGGGPQPGSGQLAAANAILDRPTSLKASAQFDLEWNRVNAQRMKELQALQPSGGSHRGAHASPRSARSGTRFAQTARQVLDSISGETHGSGGGIGGDGKQQEHAVGSASTNGGSPSHSVRHPSAGGGRGGSASPNRSGAAALLLSGPSAEEIVQQKRLQWVKQLMGSAVENRSAAIGGVAVRSICPNVSMKKSFLSPLLDVSSGKFMCGIDIHAGTAASSQHVRTVHAVDPTTSIELPAKTTHVKIKFQHPLVRDVSIEDLIQQSAGGGLQASTLSNSNDAAEGGGGAAVSLSAVVAAKRAAMFLNDEAMSSAMEWSPVTQVTKLVGTSGGTQAAVATGARSVSPHMAHNNRTMSEQYWTLYRRMYGMYKPYMPRMLDAYYLDNLILRVCQRHYVRTHARYMVSREAANLRSTSTQMAKVLAERLFREEYQPTDFQLSLVDVLESRYSFPEVVGKVWYEALSSLEYLAPSLPHMRLYLDCIAGTIPFGTTYLVSSLLHAIASYWPVGLDRADETISQRDILAVFRLLYPTEAAVRVDLDSFLLDFSLSCQERITLRKTMAYVASLVMNGEESVMRKFQEAFAYRANVVQWSELEYSDFQEIVKSMLGEEAVTQAAGHFLMGCCVLGKTSRLPVSELSSIASMLWIVQWSKNRRM